MQIKIFEMYSNKYGWYKKGRNVTLQCVCPLILTDLHANRSTYDYNDM